MPYTLSNVRSHPCKSYKQTNVSVLGWVQFEKERQRPFIVFRVDPMPPHRRLVAIHTSLRVLNMLSRKKHVHEMIVLDPKQLLQDSLSTRQSLRRRRRNRATFLFLYKRIPNYLMSIAAQSVQPIFYPGLIPHYTTTTVTSIPLFQQLKPPRVYKGRNTHPTYIIVHHGHTMTDLRDIPPTFHTIQTQTLIMIRHTLGLPGHVTTRRIHSKHSLFTVQVIVVNATLRVTGILMDDLQRREKTFLIFSPFLIIEMFFSLSHSPTILLFFIIAARPQEVHIAHAPQTLIHFTWVPLEQKRKM